MSHSDSEHLGAGPLAGPDTDGEERTLLAFVNRELLKGRDVSINADTRLFEDRLVDSMNILRLIAYIERKLGRRLDEKEIVMQKFATVRAMVEAFFND
jgi:acyl carrier protein